MQKILIVAATQPEIQDVFEYVSTIASNNTDELQNVEISFIVTGVGMVNTALHLGKLHAHKFDVVINAGVAGSFDKFHPGEVVNVCEDCFSELGAEDGTEFLSSDEIGLGPQNLRIENKPVSSLISKLPVAKGITVNTVHGNEGSIEAVVKRYQPDVETMEGAAFILAANRFKWKAVQLRAISNQVERRNKKNWQMPLAIKELNTTLIALIEELDGTQ